MDKSLEERINREVHHHHKIKLDENNLKLDPDNFLDPVHGYYQETFDLLGDLNNKNVLDLGCGEGHWAIMLAKKYPKADVYAIDVADNLIEFAKKRAQFNKVEKRTHFAVMPGEFLDYPDNFFDVVLGIAVIHHLDLKQSAKELKRVLKKGGKAVFAEPLGENFVLELARKHIPYPNKNRSEDETPLKYSHIQQFTKNFSNVKLSEREFIGSLTRVVRNKSFSKLLSKFDNVVFKVLPATKRFSRYIIIELSN